MILVKRHSVSAVAFQSAAIISKTDSPLLAAEAKALRLTIGKSMKFNLHSSAARWLAMSSPPVSMLLPLREWQIKENSDKRIDDRELTDP